MSVNWGEIPFLSVTELQKELSRLECPSQITEFLQALVQEDLFSSDRSRFVQEWLKWCRQQKNRVKVVEFDVPNSILPPKCHASLYDIKVQGPRKFGPDDAMYNKYEDLRDKVARGNTVLYLNDMQEGKVSYDNLVFALRKFTGGMGDEDDFNPSEAKASDDSLIWMSYFLKPFSSTARIVCTHKANGEAAHMSVRWIRDRFVICAGSKNVHCLVRNFADVGQYKDSRYKVAGTVAESALSMIASLEPAKASILLSFMHHAQLTAVFEVLQPEYQHVVNLSHLQTSELNFITWTTGYGVGEAEKRKEKAKSLCAVAPDAALDFAKIMGLKCIGYETVESDQADSRMDKIRRDYGYEGEVLYFLDDINDVIGLLKKKTAWYVICRAIREKVAHMMQELKKNPHSFDQELFNKRLEKRLDQIQTWLGFPNEYLEAWKKLGIEYQEWMVANAKNTEESVKGKFPIFWKRFLTQEGKTDRFTWT